MRASDMSTKKSIATDNYYSNGAFPLWENAEYCLQGIKVSVQGHNAAVRARRALKSVGQIYKRMEPLRRDKTVQIRRTQNLHGIHKAHVTLNCTGKANANTPIASWVRLCCLRACKLRNIQKFGCKIAPSLCKWGSLQGQHKLPQHRKVLQFNMSSNFFRAHSDVKALWCHAGSRNDILEICAECFQLYALFCLAVLFWGGKCLVSASYFHDEVMIQLGKLPRDNLI